MRNPEFVTALQTAIARRDQADAQRIIEAYARDKSGNYTQFKSYMINSIATTINNYAYYLQNPPSSVAEASDPKLCCALVTCVATTTCLFSSNGSCLATLLCGTSSYFFCKDAIEEETKQLNHNKAARLNTLENSAENLFKICDDYCNRFRLPVSQNHQPSHPITHSAPML